MSFPYLTALDSLVLDTADVHTGLMDDQAAAADLALWTNAKFTYDITPGQGLLDDKSVDLDHLTQYFNMEIKGLEEKATTISPTALAQDADPLTSLDPAPESQQNKVGRLLLPRPLVMDPSQSILTMPTSSSSSTKPTKKRVASDDDDAATPDDEKRRRNTAASARFRLKKKLREQAMADTVQEMTDKADSLQNRVNELETEVKFLRGLLLEKGTLP
ncbi:hypothetical protein DM01DRAFT_1372085 [Hesseltinella vesiculosa]|uniref:BZIP domain-containing protein n=1 Tax=Hesseltinella vesiculosa TaxID=101127 RepID=A0A1X2GPW6_9FUNG|nr:hypothetical protein DM01DRAFT_1372085 [Hesseltinella vesiculosa]